MPAVQPRRILLPTVHKPLLNVAKEKFSGRDDFSLRPSLTEAGLPSLGNREERKGDPMQVMASVRLDGRLWQAFKTRCVRDRIPMREATEVAVRDYLEKKSKSKQKKG